MSRTKASREEEISAAYEELCAAVTEAVEAILETGAGKDNALLSILGELLATVDDRSVRTD